MVDMTKGYHDIMMNYHERGIKCTSVEHGLIMKVIW